MRSPHPVHKTFLLSLLLLSTYILLPSTVGVAQTVNYAAHPNLIRHQSFDPGTPLPERIAVNDGYCYAVLNAGTTSTRLATLDRNTLTQVGSDFVLATGNPIGTTGVAATEQRLYAIAKLSPYQLKTYDVSNPGTVTELSAYTVNLGGAGQLLGIMRRDDLYDYLCVKVAGSVNAVHLYRIDPVSGQPSSTHDGYRAANLSLIDASVYSQHVYCSYVVANQATLVGFNFQRLMPYPGEPPNALTLSGNQAGSVAVLADGSHLFAHENDPSAGQRFRCLKLDDGQMAAMPGNPAIPINTTPSDALCPGATLIVGDMQGTDYWLRLYDASTAEAPYLMSSFTATQPVPQLTHLAAWGDTIYGSGGPVLGRVDMYAMQGLYDQSRALHALGDATDILPFKSKKSMTTVCYVAGTDGLRVCPTSEGALQAPTASYLAGTAVKSLSVSDSDVLVVCTNVDVKMYSIDASTPATLVKVGEFQPAQGTPNRGVLLGGRMYLATSYGLSVYSITPSTPLWTATHVYTMETPQEARDVLLRKQSSYQYAYVAAGSAGVRVMRVAANGTLTNVGSASMTAAGRMFFRENRLYVANGADGVAVVNVTTPANPVMDTMIGGNNVTGVTGAGQWLYIADGPAVRVYDVASAGAPTRVGMLNTRADVVGVGCTNALFVIDPLHVRSGLLQTGSVPTLLSGTASFAMSFQVPANNMIWEFSWRTNEWCDPSRVSVVIRNLESEGMDCVPFGSGTVVSADDPGVTTWVRPAIEGGYRVSLSFNAGSCSAVCNYAFIGRCAITGDAGAVTETVERPFSVVACLP